MNEKFDSNIVSHSIEAESFLSNNYWLAGFIDADGGFKIRYSQKRVNKLTNKVLSKGRIEMRFALEQRQYHPKNQAPYEKIMQRIADFFSVNLKISHHNAKVYWTVEVFSVIKLQLLVDYLNKYPLKTIKSNDYSDWLKAFNLVKTNQHLTESGAKAIQNIKSNMNRKRTVFDWSHLE